MKYLIFNLKSKLNYQDLDDYSSTLNPFKKDFIIAPSFLYLPYFQNKGYNLCAQDVSQFPMGNYTGEVSAQALSSLNVKYTLIGHYERRKYFKEDKEALINKVKEALKNNLKIILCLSELKENYNFKELKEQIDDIFNSLNINELNNIIIAYEPALMIGNNMPIDTLKIDLIIKKIRSYIKKEYLFNNEIIYGGSVNLTNLNEIKKLDVDGLLIGEISTQLDTVLTLLKRLKQ